MKKSKEKRRQRERRKRMESEITKSEAVERKSDFPDLPDLIVAEEIWEPRANTRRQ